MVTIYAYSTRSLTFETWIGDLVMQARNMSYDVVGLGQARRYHPFIAVYDWRIWIYGDMYMMLRRWTYMENGSCKYATVEGVAESVISSSRVWPTAPIRSNN
ncbi:unnamed protein product [Angiostrongylus costaricensis]|uniref:Uncharacterized protein n=1 Tax=Angiostrongylus costaricensis TaxID=334426 RepID=A0A0R3PHP2_ANGCS|nr:unnamed protein product [Angiostrongylus costaricensis]